MQQILDLPAAGIELSLKLVALVVIVYLAGIIRGFAGFGSALLVVPALSVLFGPVQAVVIEVLVEIPISLGLLPTVIREAERRTVVPMLLMFVVFVPVGALLLTVTDPQIIRILISVFVLAMVLVLWQQRKMAAMLSSRATLGVGAVAGVAQGLTGMAGPLFVTALMARGEAPALTRANIIALAGGLIAISAVSFWIFGLIHPGTLAYAALATPAILAGVWTGSWAFRKLSHWNIRAMILVFLAAIALITLWQNLA